MKRDKGITLITLVITIIILIILAGVAINLSIGENGIFTKAKESKKIQKIAEIKEQIGTEILEAQIEAIARDESLEKEQIEDIISNYGELQEDGDTIILKDVDEKVSLLDIYNGTTVTSGSYSENKAKIELLETQVAKLEQQFEDSSKSESEKSQELSELKQSISDAKTLIASAITANGVTTSADDTFETMAANISGIINNTPIYSNPIRQSYTAPNSYGAGTTLSSVSNYRTICYHVGTNSPDRNGTWYLKKADGTVVKSISLGSESGGTNSTYGYIILDPNETYYVQITTRWGYCFTDHWFS